jgi:probable HAF family extracellular repeat protein
MIRGYNMERMMNMLIKNTSCRLGGALLLAGTVTLLPVTPRPLQLAWAGTATTRYSISDLGTLGGTFSRANAINSLDQIVGGSLNTTPDPTIPGSTEVRAFLWSRGRMTDLGTFGGPDANQINGNRTGATSINDQDQIVGGATYNAKVDLACNSDAEPYDEACNHAFLWARGKMTFLGTLGGVTTPHDSFSVANGII